MAVVVEPEGSRPPHDALPASDYRPPVDDILAALDVAGLPGLMTFDDFGHIDRDTVETVVREFGRFAAEVIGPTDRTGDVVGSHLDPASGTVRTPPGFASAYRRYVESGWGSLPFPAVYGGGGLPSLVGMALQEMFASANMALSLNPVLTQGAIELLLAWGDDQQRGLYLPKLLTGEWSGTMNLTEPEAGSDLGEVRCRAEPHSGGTWRLTGSKIFITWGEHDLADNIVHLVLARTPGAPAGTKGLSLFLVPKYLLDDRGEPGTPNTVRCARVEGKLGIHASPTCVLEYESATGTLVGPECGGMRAMFTMMNAARLSIGVQGPAVGERAFQQALHYASARRQGRGPGVAPPARSALVEHPDVRRMLLRMRTSVLAARLLLYTAACQGDTARHAPDELSRRRAQGYVDLLTPVAKAWATDVGVATASLGMQVLGGVGYVEETGMAQRLRDARITPIYEGTNGIQAVDLVTRKLPRDGGRWIRMLLDDVGTTLSTVGTNGRGLTQTFVMLADAHRALDASTAWMLGRLENQPEDALAGASAYLELAALTVGGWLMARRALHARAVGGPDADVASGESEFFASEIVAAASGLVRPIVSGAERLAVLAPSPAP